MERQHTGVASTRGQLTAGQLRALRAYLGLSAKAWAARIGVHERTLIRWESEPRPAGLDTYYSTPRHTTMSSAQAQQIKQLAYRIVRRKGLSTDPLKDIFYPVESST